MSTIHQRGWHYLIALNNELRPLFVASATPFRRLLPVQSFQDLLKDMATLARNSIRFESSESEFHQLTESTTLQRRVFELIANRA